MSNIVKTSKGTLYLNQAADTELAKKETNDCVVRAVAAAFVLDYDKAHAWVKKTFNRVDRKGTHGFATYFLKASKEQTPIHGKAVEVLGEGNQGSMKTVYGVNKWQMTVGTFLKMYPKGTFLLSVRKHAFVIKDGVVMGNHSDATRLRTRVWTAVEVK
jgi:hypothetical protein